MQTFHNFCVRLCEIPGEIGSSTLIPRSYFDQALFLQLNYVQVKIRPKAQAVKSNASSQTVHFNL